MPQQQQQWILASIQPPESFVQAVRNLAPNVSGYAAQLLWQRGIQDLQQLPGFVNPKLYQPASPFEFGQEMHQAVERLQLAKHRQEKVTIWGDFDADGITSTAVLWDGLGQFFPPTSLSYYIPNRLTESHGLNCQGITRLASHGCKLIVTCDTGSTNLNEIDYANSLGIDIIITDHHTLPAQRPPVVAIINPRYLPVDHSLFHLSGVAVAYKLVEALYQTLPDVPQQPLSNLLDLVAIGLIADLVQLSGDCRYLAQLGIEQMQQDFKQPADLRRRPGVGKLLELCQKSGDRPTDISFGLGPRINAVSRIQGDASFCVELLTSQDQTRVNLLAQDTELANTRRKSLQKEVAALVAKKLAQLDLSTTSVIVLEDSQWQPGVLGLVAGLVAQETGRPTILLSTQDTRARGLGLETSEGTLAQELETSVIGARGWKLEASEGTLAQELETRETKEQTKSEFPSPQPPASSPSTSPQPPASSPTLLARGSARSVNNIDLYQLVKDQAHLLHRFGGHPFAAGLSLPVENIPLFTQAINQRLRQQKHELSTPLLQADLAVTVSDLGKDLFWELKLLEPYGMGNPVPKLLIQNCWFEKVWNQNIRDSQGKEVKYIKTEFKICDDSFKSGFPGVWWGHYRDEIPSVRCDAIVELDFNSYQDPNKGKKPQYEVRLCALRPCANATEFSSPSVVDWIIDWRHQDKQLPVCESVLPVTTCPSSWDDLQPYLRRALFEKKQLAIAWKKPSVAEPDCFWQQLVGIAKYLRRTGKTVTRVQLCQKLGISDRLLLLGFEALSYLGFHISSHQRYFSISASEPSTSDITCLQAIEKFIAAVREEQFKQQYFYQVPLATIRAIAAVQT